MTATTAIAGSDGLDVRGVTVAFKGVKALENVDLTLSGTEILGLIGPNGAGKTTLVNVASGFQPPTEGDLFIAGRRMTGRPPARFTHAGVARTFQAVRPFGRLSVRENLRIGALASSLSSSAQRAWVTELMERFDLAPFADGDADQLTYGQQRRLGIARALATRPRQLLLDEPAAGLNEGEGAELQEMLRGIPRDFGCAVLLIEHDMPLVMALCDRIQVLNYGQTIAVGTPEEIRAHPLVREAYLGQEGTE